VSAEKMQGEREERHCEHYGSDCIIDHDGSPQIAPTNVGGCMGLSRMAEGVLDRNSDDN
jgi:hypothetical protein